MQKEKIKLNIIQIQWLDDHGGRNANDVELDEIGPYVWMSDGYGGDLKVYIDPVNNEVENSGDSGV